jgi:hypothetical protein
VAFLIEPVDQVAAIFLSRKATRLDPDFAMNLGLKTFKTFKNMMIYCSIKLFPEKWS